MTEFAEQNITNFLTDKFNFFMGFSVGDEGKGCVFTGITHMLINEGHNLILVRCNGGCQAGNSVMIMNKDNIVTKKAFHAFPVVTNMMDLNKVKCIAIFGVEYVFDPKTVLDEAEFLRSIGYTGKIMIGENVTISLFEHTGEDAKNLTVGSTGRGIGPAKISRFERHVEKCSSLLQAVNAIKNNKIGKHITTTLPIEDMELYNRVLDKFDELNVEIVPQYEINDFISQSDAKVLVMGAHGAGIALESYRQPYVTTSDIFPFSAFNRHYRIKGSSHVNGIFKLPYMTRVGTGICTPYKSEAYERAIFGIFLILGNEFGSTTGRQRKVCWNNLAELKSFVKQYNPDSLSLTKLDLYLDLYNEVMTDLNKILSDEKTTKKYEVVKSVLNFTDDDVMDVKQRLLNETLTCKFIEGYMVNGNLVDFPYKAYTENDGFVDDYGNGKFNEELEFETIVREFPFPKTMEEVNKIVEYVENFLGVKIKVVSTGPQFDDVKLR